MITSFKQYAEEEIESKIEVNAAYRQKTEEQQTLLEWQIQKLSEAEQALSKSGVSQLLFLSNKVTRPESKFSKVSRGPMSRSLNIKMNVALEKHSLLANTPVNRKYEKNIHELRFKNRTLTEKDLQNSSDSLKSKPPGLHRQFSGRHVSLARVSIH